MRRKKMNLLEKTDEEISNIANPLWDNLVKSSNNKDYFEFIRDFSAKMLFGANEVEIGKQWANNKLLTSLDENRIFLQKIAWEAYLENSKLYNKKM